MQHQCACIHVCNVYVLCNCMPQWVQNFYEVASHFSKCVISRDFKILAFIFARGHGMIIIKYNEMTIVQVSFQFLTLGIRTSCLSKIKSFKHEKTILIFLALVDYRAELKVKAQPPAYFESQIQSCCFYNGSILQHDFQHCPSPDLIDDNIFR